METDGLVLMLFISGTDVASLERAQRVTERLGDKCVLLVIDIGEDPELAEAVGVEVTPALIRLSPDPRRKVIGDLGDQEEVAAYLGAVWSPRPA